MDGSSGCNADVKMQETCLSLHCSCLLVPSNMAEVVEHHAARGTVKTNTMGSRRKANVGLRPVQAHWPLAKLKASEESRNAMNADGENKTGRRR